MALSTQLCLPCRNFSVLSRSKGLCSNAKSFWFRSQSSIVDFVKRKAPEAEALKSLRWGRCVDVGFGTELEKIPGFISCDDSWISLHVELVKCEAVYTYLLSPSRKGVSSMRFESFSPIDTVLYNEAAVEERLSL